ncbi:GspE/PulE family protein [Aquabacterium sp.]|uniref:GspE/PulE family protein n=1 Tax=Aquabacterium sp. TaxID=1872578 RepID=UPI0019BDA807|nr:GspE/PulE family protein [Aquabacterium sp.]MBC7701779.1 type II/IV secretion system protein [Aquabacterium sp.]
MTAPASFLHQNLPDAIRTVSVGGRPTDLLASLQDDFYTNAELVGWLGRELNQRVVQMLDLAKWTAQFELLSFVDSSRMRCALALDENGTLQFVVTDPFDQDRLAWARTIFGPHAVVLASKDTLDAWLSHCEAHMSALGTMTVASTNGASRGTAKAEQLSLLQIGADESPAVRFVNSTLFDALRTGSSDVHLECDPNGLSVKFRIDGVLSLQRHIDSIELATQSISRIKVMAQLDIAERRVPQDGRLQINFEGRSIDIRVSIMPSIHGEDAVLRVLDRQHLAQSLEGLTLSKLGFNLEAITALQRWSCKSHGMMLVTGPTGSGKTTTLYAAIAETHNPRDKIITIEDPVEYQLPGVLQIPVNERKGLTFARGLRSILRHDPDKILVGEIRDAETAQIAIQSALTGHLVFTTVHANNVFDVVGRFSQFDIDVYTFASAINGIVAQRLLRKVCLHCAAIADHESDLPTADDQEQLTGPAHNHRWLKARGCEHCRGSGYSGRFALGEILEMTPAMKGLIAARTPLDQLQLEAQKNGWISLRGLALNAAAQGMTSIEEVNRVAS